MEMYGTNYLEERKLVKRWGGPIPALVCLVFTLAIFYATWWIFQDPNGLMRMYTPYVGYMYTRWWLIILIWMVYIFGYWPFKRAWLEQTHPVVKGAVLTAVSVAVLYVLIKGFFEGILGNFGLAYFNPERLTKWSMSQIRLRIQGPFSIDSGGQAKSVDSVRLRLDFFESFFEVIFGVFPFEWLGDLIIQVLKLMYGGFKNIEVLKVVWCQHFALQN